MSLSSNLNMQSHYTKQFSDYVNVHNHQRIFTISLVILFISVFLGLTLDLWISRSAIIDSEHELFVLYNTLLMGIPIICLCVGLVFRFSLPSNPLNIGGIFSLNASLAAIHTVILTDALTFSPISIIAITLMAKIFILKTISLIFLFGSYVLFGFLTIVEFHDTETLGIQFYFFLVMLFIWLLYLGLDHYKKERNQFVYKRRQARQLSQITLQRMLIESHNMILERKSNVDELTALYNRRFFEKAYNDELLGMNRSYRSLAVLLVDIDHFKAVNDSFGHDRGDQCIRQIATALNQCVTRKDDVVARYGGEEFIVLLPNTDIAGALGLANHINQSIRRLNLQHPFMEHVTVSIGGAVASNKITDRKAFIKKADENLYTVKHNGRDGACILRYS
jgi:diguanylate cyclase (GGDEF)-like protein